MKTYTYDEKKLVVNQMVSGHPVEEAIELSGVSVSVRNAYRWLAAYRKESDAGLREKRGGVVWKFTVEMREWLYQRCHDEPTIIGRDLQAELLREFNAELSIAYINELRVNMGISTRELQKNKATPSPRA